MSDLYSVGLFNKNRRQEASDHAIRMIAEGYSNVYIEIVWTSVTNARTLGPYVGFYANGSK